MTKEEILNKAVYIQFPLQKSDSDPRAIPDTYKEHDIEGIIKLPPSGGMLYKGWISNRHHYTTEYHKKYVIPLLVDILNIEYNESDFTWPSRVSGKFDVTIPVPIRDYKFSVTCFDENKTEEVDYNGLVTAPKDVTEFHRLFRFSHRNSRTINLTIDNDRKLFISGDSQLVPDIGFLCCFFKEVWYLDNRHKLPLYEKFKDINFDKVLIEMFALDQWWYTEAPFL